MAHLTNFSFDFVYKIFTRCLSTASIPWCKKFKNDQKLKARGPVLRPAGGVNHPDSVSAKVGKLAAKKALRWLEGSILSNSRTFQGCALWFSCSTGAKCAENMHFLLASNWVCDLKIAALFVLAYSWCPSAKNGVSDFQISNRKLVKYLETSENSLF